MRTVPENVEERQVRELPSVDTISGAEIRTYQQYDVEDILFRSAGVSLVQAGQAGGQTSLFIRGMESNHTVVLLNGRRLPPGLAGLYQLEFLDVSTMESVQTDEGGLQFALRIGCHCRSDRFAVRRCPLHREKHL